MKISDLDTSLDRFVDKTFLWAIPVTVKPNSFTYFRLVSAPVILFLLWSGYVRTGFILTIVAMLTDLIDGTLARTRNQITSLGKVIDPIADKMTVLAVLLFVGLSVPIARYVSVLILFEIVGVIIGVIFTKYFGTLRHEGANTYGKIKMWLQCFGVIFYLMGVFLGIRTLVTFGVALLVLGIFFAIVSAYGQIKPRIEQAVTYLQNKGQSF